jgi:hypothetical protein
VISSDARLSPARARSSALIIGISGLAVSVLGWVMRPREFFLAYLFGFLVWIGLALGSAGWLMIHHLTGGRWGYPVRRMFESAMGTLPLLAVLFLPILFGLKELYPWADAARLATDPVLQHKHAYMNAWAFIIRAVIIFAIWIWLARRLINLSAAQDCTSSVEPTKKLRALSGPGLVIYPLTVTFAYVDWVMSMEADWYSTVFPLLICVGQMLTALALMIVLVAGNAHSSLAAIISKENFHQLGNLLLAFTMMWAYLAYSQLIVIWSGDLPHEISWYLHRIAGGWRWIAVTLLLLHFFGPFCLLLFRATKRSVRSLMIVAAVIFATHIVDVWWLVAPSLYPNGFHLSWLAPVAFLGLGGIWFAVFLTNLTSTAILPLNDPRFALAVTK